jgi:hypothetical protein
MEWIARLHMAVFGVVVTLGALAGMGLALLNPPMQSCSSLVVVVPAVPAAQRTQAIRAAEASAKSDPVLEAASRHGLLSFEQLTHQVRVTVAGANILAITVTAHTALDAQAAANDVALGDVAFVNGPRPGYPLRAVVMDPGAPPATTGTSSPSWVAGFAMLGALAGAGLMIMWRPVPPR